MLKSFNKIFSTGTLLLAGMYAQAQDAVATAAAATAASSDNSLLYLLVTGCLVLLIAVVLLGNVWVNLTKLVLDKRAAKTSALLLLMFCSHILLAQDVTQSATPAAVSSSSSSLSTDVIIGIFVFAIELMVVIWMLLAIRSLINELSPAKESGKSFSFHFPKLFDNINASVAIEKEQDIMLDHDYDGIRELDNTLPPWWKYSFYISIVWSVFYLGYYYIGGGPSGLDEYKTEVQQAKIAVEEYNKKNALNVDEHNITMADASGVAAGMEIFKTNCTACHGNVGEGNGVGPNLTDDYWLHSGSISDIFKSVKYGWPAKGMKSWQSDLSPVQIKNVVSYIHSLHGSNPPNAKAPQGDLYKEGTPAAKTDSTEVALAGTTAK